MFSSMLIKRLHKFLMAAFFVYRQAKSYLGFAYEAMNNLLKSLMASN